MKLKLPNIGNISDRIISGVAFFLSDSWLKDLKIKKNYGTNTYIYIYITIMNLFNQSLALGSLGSGLIPVQNPLLKQLSTTSLYISSFKFL